MGLDLLSFGSPAIGQGLSIYKSQQADKQMRRAADLQRRQEAFKALRERRDFIRSARSAAAKITQGAENAGVASSSAAQGGIGSIINQAASGLSFLDQYNAFSTEIGKVTSKASKLQSDAQRYAAIAEFSSSGAKMIAGAG